MKATAAASPNLAIIKYWGKRDELLKLPYHDSISVTLDKSLRSITTVEFSPTNKEDTMTLDGKAADEKEKKNIRLVLDYIRSKAKKELKATIKSENNFPKASGMASSSSGYAALAVAASKALDLQLTQQELSIAARIGSGSACRSVIGGFVQWKKGNEKDGSDSHALQIADENHWEEFRIVTGIISNAPKLIGSTEGMKRTVETSRLYQERLANMPGTVSGIKKAIIEKDAETFFELAMKESNSLHSVMMDSYPPIIYLNDSSRQIIAKVHQLNETEGKTVAGYTFDAGPNAHIFTLAKNENDIKGLLNEIEGLKGINVSVPGKGPEIIHD